MVAVTRVIEIKLDFHKYEESILIPGYVNIHDNVLFR